ncbi:urease accessory protein UreH domain-containing protein [Prochlorothrix hollandica]|uniref:urease accessory protein UreH domain-containing protein n=1 Tax=Prochlorothrix hollandica TaxID=1223 RepID=UPI00034D75C0|nr:sulfite exporter TauE/SafE family protein [Prochlorothrix hollandica]
MLDLFLMVSLGFLGSFGHCLGMCGPLSLAFTLPQGQGTQPPDRSQPLRFQLLLNLGRILSYGLVGAAIGWVGSVLLAGGQMAGIGSDLRRIMGWGTGGLLVWFGLGQVSPGLLPSLPLLNPMAQGRLHDRLSRTMARLGQGSSVWTPLGLGLVWGFMPCGFLYAAQIKAADSGHWLQGAATMVAFGLGTTPTLVGVGVSAGLLSRDRRSQLFRMGGWITLIIGLLTLTRTGDTMADFSGHGALLCLGLALVARPLSPWWSWPLTYRRALGVGGFGLAVAHSLHRLEHSWQWNWRAVTFLLPQHQWAMGAGALALVLLAPAACTSFDRAQRILGHLWRRIHLLTLPAFLLAAVHALVLGSHYLGQLQVTGTNGVAIALLGFLVTAVLGLRSPWFSRHFIRPTRAAALDTAPPCPGCKPVTLSPPPGESDPTGP